MVLHRPIEINNVGCVNLFFKRTSPFTSESVFVRRVLAQCRRPRLACNLSVGFSPTHTSLRSNFRPRLLVQTPSCEGAGCPFIGTAFYCTPCPVPSCPACEPNATHCAYSQPFRHIQYSRTASLRAIATLAMFRCRRTARCI